MDENEFDFYDIEEAIRFLKEESESEDSNEHLMMEEKGSEIKDIEVNLLKIESENEESKPHLLLKEVIKSENEGREIPSCPECNKNYDQESDLLEHMKSAHDPYMVKKKKHGTKHKKSKVKEELLDESALCNLCGKKFESSQKMVAHAAVVHSQGEAKCELCGNVFKHKYYLRAHMNYVHASSNLDNYQKWLLCDICCKSFKNAANLFSHKKHVHEFEPGLSCSLCTASARNKYALRKHVKKCSKKDPSKRKVPKENQDFPCRKCSSQFSSKSNLKLHHNYAHEIVPTQCQLCFKRFKNFIHVRQHLRRTHSQDTTHDLYLILNKDTSQDEFLPKMEVDLLQEDPMLLVYKRQACRLSQQTSTAHPGDDISYDTSVKDDEAMISEELDGIDHILESIETSDKEKLLKDVNEEQDNPQNGLSLLEKYSEIFEEI